MQSSNIAGPKSISNGAEMFGFDILPPRRRAKCVADRLILKSPVVGGADALQQNTLIPVELVP